MSSVFVQHRADPHFGASDALLQSLSDILEANFVPIPMHVAGG
jgi:hypothetical protein